MRALAEGLFSSPDVSLAGAPRLHWNGVLSPAGRTTARRARMFIGSAIETIWTLLWLHFSGASSPLSTFLCPLLFSSRCALRLRAWSSRPACRQQHVSPVLSCHGGPASRRARNLHLEAKAARFHRFARCGDPRSSRAGGGEEEQASQVRATQLPSADVPCSPMRIADASPRRTPHNTSTPALEAILARTARPSAPSRAPPPPSYQPTSLPALLERISTYRLATFSPSKPPSLSALSCALHGWVHTPSTRERLQCVTCGNGVVVLPPSAGDGAWSSPAGQRLRQEYERQLGGQGHGQAHAESCPWRLRPCARSLYRLPGGGLGVSWGGRRHLLEELWRDAEALDHAGLGQVSLALPESVRDTVESEEGQARLVKAVASVADSAASGDRSPSTAAGPPSLTSILLCIFGWNLVGPMTLVPAAPPLPRSNSTSSLSSVSDASSPILCCTYCTRRVLASSYLPSSQTGTAEKRFDPVGQHQAFCPFVSTAQIDLSPSDRAAKRKDDPPVTARKPGWLVRLEAVLPRAPSGATAERIASTPTTPVAAATATTSNVSRATPGFLSSTQRPSD